MQETILTHDSNENQAPFDVFGFPQASKSLKVLGLPVNRPMIWRCMSAKEILDDNAIRRVKGTIESDWRTYQVKSQSSTQAYTVKVKDTAHFICSCRDHKAKRANCCKHTIAVFMMEFKERADYIKQHESDYEHWSQAESDKVRDPEPDDFLEIRRVVTQDRVFYHGQDIGYIYPVNRDDIYNLWFSHSRVSELDRFAKRSWVEEIDAAKSLLAIHLQSEADEVNYQEWASERDMGGY